MNQAAIEAALKDLAAPQRRVGSVVLLVLACTAGVFIWCGLPLLGLLVVSPGKAAEPVPAEKLTKKQGDFNSLLASSGQAIVAREPWGKVSVGKAKSNGPKTPPVASRYAGPAIVGMINDAVWFADGKRVKIGESSEGSMGVTVLSVAAPWSAKVRWGGAEFTVSLFERDPAKWTRALSEWNGPPPVVTPPPGAPDPTKVAGGTPGAPAPGAPGAPTPAPAPGTPGLPQGIQLPPGAVISGVPVITGGPGTIVITSTPGATPPPPPPPPEDPEK